MATESDPKQWEVHRGRMTFTEKGSTVAVSCVHRSNGACGGCAARWYFLLEKVEHLLNDDKRSEALMLIQSVFAIAKRQNDEVKGGGE